MKVVDIANEIYVDAGSPTETSIPAIAFWIRGKIGTVNTLLFEDFTIDNTTQELVKSDGSDIPYETAAVIKQMYRIYDYEVQIRNNMNALNVNNILSIEDQGTTITRVNRNSISQTFAQIRRDELATLKELVNAYRNKYSTPQQIAGDDTEVGWNAYPSLFPFYTRR